MKISAISSFGVKNCATKVNNSTNNCTTTPTQEVKNKPNFAGFMSHAVNSSRKYIDYGNIFRPNTDFYSVASKKDFNGHGCFSKAQKHFAQVMNSIFRKVKFAESDLKGSNFSGSKFHEVDFSRAILADCDFSKTTLDDVDFRLSDLRNSNFTSSNANSFINLGQANLSGANLSGINLAHACLVGAVCTESTKFPSGFDYYEEGVKFFRNGEDFSERDFEEMFLDNTKLNNINFDKSRFDEAILDNSVFRNCTFNNTSFRKTQMENTILENCSFNNAYLRQISLNGSKLKNVDLRNTNLCGALLNWDSAQEVYLDGAIYDQFTQFPSNFKYNPSVMEYKESRLEGDYIDTDENY